jgi:hypothetical protein
VKYAPSILRLITNLEMFIINKVIIMALVRPSFVDPYDLA